MSFIYRVSLMDEDGKVTYQQTIRAYNYDRALDMAFGLMRREDHAQGFIVKRIRDGEE